MIICISGLPGTGKTTIANSIKKILKEKKIRFFHYTTDWIRYKLYPELLGDRESKDKIFQDFTPDQLARSYNGLYMLIDQLLEANPQLVIITDGQFRKESQRVQLAEIAKKHETECFILKTEVEEKVILSRLEQRLETGKGSGKANYLAVKDQYEEPTGENLIVIKNNGNLKSLESEIKKALGKILNS